MRGHHQLELGVSAHIGNLIGRSGLGPKWCDAWF
jgi:hypothetical protein